MRKILNQLTYQKGRILNQFLVIKERIFVYEISQDEPKNFLPYFFGLSKGLLEGINFQFSSISFLKGTLT